MRYPSSDQIAWTFETAQFRVVLSVEPEDHAPDFDDDGQTARDIEAGRVDWFCAFVSVWFMDGDDPIYLAHDCLGGCAYNSVREFYTSHRDKNPMNRNSSLMRAKHGQNTVICHYFPDMVSTAIAEARKAVKREAGLFGQIASELRS